MHNTLKKMNTTINNIKNSFQNAEIVEKLIYINVGVYVLTFLLSIFKSTFLFEWFALFPSFNQLLNKPWTIISYGFLHANFIHILLNLIALFYIGNLFKQYFTAKQVLNFYVYGTIFGGLIYLLGFNYLPILEGRIAPVVGASAGISAIFVGLATYIPNYELKFPLIGFVKLWVLAAIWVVLDIIQIPTGNAGGHLAHLGGALFGFLYVQQASNKELNLFSSFFNLFKKKEKKLKTVYKSSQKNTRKNSVKSENQQQIDAILDKIGKSGYDALTKAEKEFLFKQGK